MSQLFL